jgi:hypothetical protein
MRYYRLDDYSLHQIDPHTYAKWVADGNVKAQRYAPLPDPPEFDPATQTCEWGQGEWVVAQIPPPTRRVWQTAADFWASFTLPEQVAVSASDIPAVRALVVSLSVWQAEMWSDDPRVQAGFHALIQSGLLTEERANEILHPPGLQP